MKTMLMTAFAGGSLALAGPTLAQNAAPERVVITHEVIASPPIALPDTGPVAAEKLRWSRAINGGGSGGGLGGAIGGYYVNGTTRSDNRPLPGGTWPYR
jgi:hypothetical protein